MTTGVPNQLSGPGQGTAPYHALADVLEERQQQHATWGAQRLDAFGFLAVLVEEVGELSQAVLQTRFGGDKGGMAKMRTEAVQCAAVALQIVEAVDRGLIENAGGVVGSDDTLPADYQATP